ncbi:dynamin family protein [Paenibacillus ihuae]|uniref:dynamin family protein n=1 Tax=Paenibacillus ihuae TaxID=1232431 RepID=UPI0006D5AA23|nr:dynamin family protein [Paenibacillus ihuae]
MNQIRSILNEIAVINNSHKLPSDSINSLLDEINTSKVCTPVIGKFSAGKSALLNTLLGYSRALLKENITPETAVPTEIIYQEQDSVVIVHTNDQMTVTDISSFRAGEFNNAAHVESIRLQLRNEHLLARIPEVMVVDMPGFESGIEVHNLAIDRYLPQSLAYILTFPADDMVLKSSSVQILRELNLHHTPVCIVITKSDKVGLEELELGLSHLKDSIRKYIEQPDQITYCVTSSNKGDVEELEGFLLHIQNQSAQLLGGKFRTLALQEANTTGNYLKMLIQSKSLSVSELEEQEEQLNRRMLSLNSQLTDDNHLFEKEIPLIVRDIQNDVRSSLTAEENTLCTLILNKQDIAEKVNHIVRESLTRSIQERLLPKVRRYLKKLTDRIHIDFGADSGFSFEHLSIDTDSITKKIMNGVIAGISLIIFGPLFTVIGALAKHFIGKHFESKKRTVLKEEIRHKLQTEVYPAVITQVGSHVEAEITDQIHQLNASISGQVEQQRSLLEKALSELKAKRDEEQELQDELLSQAAKHLYRIEEINHEL